MHSEVKPCEGSSQGFALRDFTSTATSQERLRFAVWAAFSHGVFQRWWLPRRFRPAILRTFGATVGRRAVIRHAIDIHMPWNLRAGDDVWIGVGVVMINHEPVVLGHDVCISQQAMLCTSGHDPHSGSFAFRHRPIWIGNHVWITARATVYPGTTIPSGSVVRPVPCCATFLRDR